MEKEKTQDEKIITIIKYALEKGDVKFLKKAAGLLHQRARFEKKAEDILSSKLPSMGNAEKNYENGRSLGNLNKKSALVLDSVEMGRRKALQRVKYFVKTHRSPLNGNDIVFADELLSFIDEHIENKHNK